MEAPPGARKRDADLMKIAVACHLSRRRALTDLVDEILGPCAESAGGGLRPAAPWFAVREADAAKHGNLVLPVVPKAPEFALYFAPMAPPPSVAPVWVTASAAGAAVAAAAAAAVGVPPPGFLSPVSPAAAELAERVSSIAAVGYSPIGSPAPPVRARSARRSGLGLRERLEGDGGRTAGSEVTASRSTRSLPGVVGVDSAAAGGVLMGGGAAGGDGGCSDGPSNIAFAQYPVGAVAYYRPVEEVALLLRQMADAAREEAVDGAEVGGAGRARGATETDGRSAGGRSSEGPPSPSLALPEVAGSLGVAGAAVFLEALGGAPAARTTSIAAVAAAAPLPPLIAALQRTSSIRAGSFSQVSPLGGATLARSTMLPAPRGRLPVLRVCALGGTAALHRLVCALVAIAREAPARLAALDVRVYVVPGAHNAFAQYLASVDGWYRRNVYSAFRYPLQLVPRLRMSKAGNVPDEVVTPASRLRPLLQNYFRGAAAVHRLRVWDCEAWVVAPPKSRSLFK